jgi:hypothetical protein
VVRSLVDGGQSSRSSWTAIYLNDHLAGSVVGVELARRAARNNRGTEYGTVLAGLVDELVEDRRALETILDRLDIGTDRAKLAVAWAAEKLGRLKLNGRLVGYSPLSRLEELEVLALAVDGKLRLWQALALSGQADGGLTDVDLPELVKRARSQRRRIERQRLRAADEALILKPRG